MTRRSDAPGLRPPKSPRIEDAATDQAIREHERTFADILALPASSMQIISNIELPEATDVYVPHGLGRVPRFVIISALRGDPPAAGVHGEIREGVDRTRFVKIKATGYTTSVYVDVAVM